MVPRGSRGGKGGSENQVSEEAVSRRRSKRDGQEAEDAVKNMNAHEMAEFFLSKFHIAPKVRKELDRISRHRVAERVAAQQRINVKLIEPILAKKPWDRTWDQLSSVHEEISKAHCFEKIHVSPDAEFDLCQVATLELFPTMGAPIFREGETGDKFYVVLEGSVYVESQAKGTLVTLFEGDSFGEIALLQHSVRAASVFVEDPCKLLAVSARDYERRIRPFHVIEENLKLREYNSIAAFESMEAENLKKLVNVTRIKRFQVGKDIFKEGDIEHTIMFIIKGFVEAWKKVGDQQILYGTFGPGDSLDMERVVAQKRVSYTATAVAIVDVMAIARKDIVPPKDSGVAGLIDAETMEKLLDREKRPPEGQQLEDYAKNEGLWSDYKDQLVSSVLWQNRFSKHLPKCPVTFNKYSRMKVRSDPKFQEHCLTENLASAALPACFQDPYAEKRKNVLSNTLLGEKLMAPRQFAKELSSALVHPNSGGRLKIEKVVPSSKHDGPTGKSIRESSQPIKTIAGTITQSFFRERKEPLLGPDYVDHAEERKGFVRKYTGPRELESPPPYKPRRKRPNSTKAWRFGSVPDRNSPFSAACSPAPSWGQLPERWILAPKDSPQEQTEEGGDGGRVWVPSGPPENGYHKHAIAAELKASRSGLSHAEEFLSRPETAAAMRRSAHDELQRDSLRPRSSHCHTRPWTPTANALPKGATFNEPFTRYPYSGRW